MADITADTASARHKREKSCDRREAIAVATRALIVEKGFEGLRTRDIADRVGINIATLHYHVPSKQDLIELVAESLRREFTVNRLQWWREGLSAKEELRLELEEHTNTVLESPGTMVVFSELSGRARRDPSIDAVIGPMRRFWFTQIRNILERGKAEGAFRSDLDPEAGAHIVIGTLIAFHEFSSTDRPALDALNAEIMRAVSAR